MIGAQAYYRNYGFVHFIEERRKVMKKIWSIINQEFAWSIRKYFEPLSPSFWRRVRNREQKWYE